MHHGRFLRIRPLCPEHIIGILGKARRVDLPEIAVFCVIGRGLADIVKARPCKLPHAKLRVPIVRDTLLPASGAPAGSGIAEGGTLLILIGQKLLLQREFVDTPALYQGGSLAAVYHPVRVLLMLLCIVVLAVVVACHLQNVRTLSGILPGHVIGTDGDRRILLRVMLPDTAIQFPCDLLSSLVRMGVIDFISDGPHEQGRVVSVPADPASHIPLVPLFEKTGVIIFRLRPLPHVESLIHHKEPHPVRHIHKCRVRRIMAGADGVAAHAP